MEKEVGLEWLHIHTDFSLLDGYAQVEEYSERIPQINMKYLCVTDHGMLGAVPRQVRACEVAGIKPIFGAELYLNDKHMSKEEMAKLPENEKIEAGKNYHLLSIACTNQGYSNLVQLSSKAWLQFYKKPRVTYAQIDMHKEGILFTSSCYIGEIGQAFDRYGPDIAEEVLKRYIKWFNPNFRLEIMLLDFKKQRAYDEWLIKMHIKYRIPLIISQDCHYCRKQDSQQQRYMLMIRGKKTVKDFQNIEDGADYFELQDTNLWLKSEAELDEKYWKREADGFSYSDIIPPELYTQAKRNTVEVAKMASGVEIDRSIKLPQVPDADLRLKDETLKGYKWRGFGMSPTYINRLKEELDLICKKGFASYFLIQQQITNEARRVCPELLGWGNGDEAVGPGRGSAVGSLVCYCLGITDVDPLKHDLLFSRFLSEARGGREMKTRFTNIPIPDAVINPKVIV
jgi:DNA polymerase-3 subunit alpha